MVHSETPSGTFNDCSLIGPIARSRGVITLADCVSSLGGMPLEPDAWQLDVCVAGPQKCLGGPPGMSLISVSAQAWAAIEPNPAAPRASFLSLLDWREQWHGTGSSRTRRRSATSTASRPPATRCWRRAWRRPSRGTRPRPRHAGPASGDGAAAVAEERGHHGPVRDRHRVPDGLDHEAVRAHAREPLRRDAVRRAGCREPGADRSHGTDRQRPQPGRRADGARPVPRGSRRQVRIGPGVEAALARLSSPPRA